MAFTFSPQGKTGKEKFLRMIGMFVIFGIVAWAFWMNNQSTLEKIQARNALWDQTKVLSNSERDYIQGFIRSMRNEYGVKVRIQIMTERISDQPVNSNELYIGLAPVYDEVVMIFPGLVRHALGPKFISDLENEHFTGHFSDDKWPTALMTTLSMIWGRLSSVESSQPAAPTYEDDYGNMTDPESTGHKE
ncbi:TPM domain-containing protein [Maridesulfovibrio hydrothermalis]|uniref:TPM domain-containing protein n=1 Tax=Maridesulfovibrio hydrothermalis AM13 = DSM 14728 TaxID=1121451 RepID=L0R7Y4_9BACT|nr:TPM domain-containing protein [Maridesulfovibrio hydrothermalis]CCO22849.1 conserved protein of unknown function [Maridesulfovibrio hydrothermalis AM13 = DSM 14728]